MKPILGREILDYIRSKADLSYMAKQAIVNKEGNTVGFDCHVTLGSGEILASGTAATWENARRIAVAETLERLSLKKLSKQTTSADPFGLRKVPSSSGFAAGFDEGRVRNRAIAEGLERWAWSQWIDSGHKLLEIGVDLSQLSPLGRHFHSQFFNVKFFSKKFSIELKGQKYDLVLGVVLGETEAGIFAGSRVTSSKSDLWTHGLCEATRNLKNFSIWSARGELDIRSDWYANRVRYFGRHKDVALRAIGKPESETWPSPTVDILTSVPSDFPGRVFLWRCLFKDFIPWHEGPVTRFVY